MPSKYSVDPALVYRTPDSRFSNLPGFPWSPHYGYFQGLRYAYVDEISGVFYAGRELTSDEILSIPSGEQIHWETFLCLHGVPTWSYLYRRMIKVFLSRPPKQKLKYVRRRVLAPDFLGHGRSDKPIQDEFYTWDLHHDFLIEFVRRHIQNSDRFEGGDVVGVFQDWGGILGLTLPPIFPGLFTHLLVMNTGLGLGQTPSEGWVQWHDFMARNPDVRVGPIIGRGTKHLSAEEVAAYDAPFPNKESKAGVRRFPSLVPRTPDMPGVAQSHSALAYYTHLPHPTTLRIFIAIGISDPVLGEPVMETLAHTAFGATGAFVLKIPEAGHFVQEWGGPIAEKALDAWEVECGSEENVSVVGIEWRRPRVNGAKL